MINKTDCIDYSVIFTGVSISLIDIQNILSIIILIIDILWILIKFIFKLIKYMSDGKLTQEEIDDLDNDINKIKEKGGGKDE